MGDLLLVSVLEAGLTSLQRKVFIDGEVIGRPYREIAASLGCTPQNVSLIVGRARLRLAASSTVDGLRAAA